MPMLILSDHQWMHHHLLVLPLGLLGTPTETLKKYQVAELSRTEHEYHYWKSANGVFRSPETFLGLGAYASLWEALVSIPKLG